MLNLASRVNWDFLLLGRQLAAAVGLGVSLHRDEWSFLLVTALRVEVPDLFLVGERRRDEACERGMRVFGMLLH